MVHPIAPHACNDGGVTSAPIHIARIALGLGGLAVIAADIALTLHATGALDLGNYVGQFTILSVLFVSVAMLVAASARREPRGWVHVRASALTALAVAAVLHATLLGGAAGASGPIVNTLLHTVLPLLALVEWALVPSAGRTRVVTALAGLAFAVVYLGGTLVRGAVIGWYPYDFVDPTGPAGYAGLVQSLAIVLVAFLVVGAVVMGIGMLRDRLSAARVAPPVR